MKDYTLKVDLFKKYIQDLYKSDSVEILDYHSHSNDRNTRLTFRINTLKVSEKEVLAELKNINIRVKEADIKNAYSIEGENFIELSRSNLALEYKVYIQSLSSMLPALFLNPKQGEKILDMCAAPGSKTSQISAITDTKALIYANEKSKPRFFKMQQILSNLGVKNIIYLNEDGNHLPKNDKYINYFDKILLDAPCSNEAGIDLTIPSSYMFWHPKKAKELSKLQKGLLNSAIKMLKPGGILVYSTCTYNPLENEGVVAWALEKNKEVKLAKIEDSLKPKGYKNGFTKIGDKAFPEDLKETVRVIPNDFYKGFYIAKFVKT